jgi:hypothetical protein
MFARKLESIRRSVIGLVVAAVSVAMLAAAGSASATSFVPTGHLDNLEGVVQFCGGCSLGVTGWAADGDAPKSPIYVQVNVTWKAGAVTVGQASQTQLANQYRSDLVGVVGPTDVAWGPYHGFSAVFAPPANATGGQACATAINLGLGSNRSLGCYPLQEVTVIS